jgi:hypothetical protein
MKPTAEGVGHGIEAGFERDRGGLIASRRRRHASPLDLFLIGSCGAAFAGAIKARELGRRVLIDEHRTTGAICLNVGCIPSKVLLVRSKRARPAGEPTLREALARAGAGDGCEADGVERWRSRRVIPGGDVDVGELDRVCVFATRDDVARSSSRSVVWGDFEESDVLGSPPARGCVSRAWRWRLVAAAALA